MDPSRMQLTSLARIRELEHFAVKTQKMNFTSGWSPFPAKSMLQTPFISRLQGPSTLLYQQPLDCKQNRTATKLLIPLFPIC